MDNWRPEIFWIVEGGRLQKYRRKGRCVQCGACCRDYKITYSQVVHFSGSGEQETQVGWEGWEGWSAFYAQGSWWFMKTTGILLSPQGEQGSRTECPNLTPQGLCSVWMDPEKFKPICRYWPYHPDDLKPFPSCGFSFEKCEDDSEKEEDDPEKDETFLYSAHHEPPIGILGEGGGKA